MGELLVVKAAENECLLSQSNRGFSPVKCRVANSFIRRLFGIAIVKDDTLLIFPDCRSVHAFGLKMPVHVGFLDHECRVLSVHHGLRPWTVTWHFRATHVIESRRPLPFEIGDQLVFDVNVLQQMGLSRARARGFRTPSAGFSIVETLLALPVLLFAAFVIIQVGLLWHAKFAVSHAATVAARHASVHHGSDTAIRDGLVQGLMPLVAKADSLRTISSALFRTGSELTQGISMGWIKWEVLSPTRQSFMDWGESADPVYSSDAARGEIEIPAVHLPGVAQRRLPASGVAERLDGLPVGNVSGQTIVDANNLKLHLQVGVPLRMPIAGHLLAKSLAWWSGCGWAIQSRHDRVGLIDFGNGISPSMLSSSIECRSLAARDLQGNWRPRWPVESSAVIQMQSNARRSVMKLRDRQQSPVSKQ